MLAESLECCQAELKKHEIGHILAESLECCQAEIKSMKVVICLQNLLSVARLK